jgi:pimeloyl-ACP methyl ester carboxylesterase
MDPRALPWAPAIRLEGKGAVRILLFSGFGSGPETLRELGEHLQSRAGATVVINALPRHTGDERAFLRSRGWQYLSEGERTFLEFWRERKTPVHLGGYSTGAVLALLIAARHPTKVAGLVLASPALRLAKTEHEVVAYAVGSLYYALVPAALLGSLVALMWQGRKRGWTRGRTLLRALGAVSVGLTAALGLRHLTVGLDDSGPIVRNGEAVLPPHFSRASLVTGSTLLPLQRAARWRLRRIALPVCLIFGEEDAVVDVRFATMRASANRYAELHVIPKAPHRVVSHSDCYPIVCDFVARSARA